MKIGIVGTGQMGKQLAIVFSALGDIELTSRDISKADAELRRSTFSEAIIIHSRGRKI